MTLLRSIIERPPRSQVDTRLAPAGWEGLKVAVLKELEPMTSNCQWTFDVPNITRLAPDKAFEKWGRPGLYYGLGSSSKFVEGLIHFDKPLLDCVNRAAFDGELPEAADQLILFDLLIMEEIARALQGYISESITQATGQVLDNEMSYFGQNLIPDSFQLSDPNRDWVALSLPFHYKLEENESKHPAPKPKGKKAAGKNESQRKVTVSILLAPDLFVRLSPVWAKVNDENVIPDLKEWMEQLDDYNVPLRVLAESFEMSVADCTRLEIGQTIELPGISLQNLTLKTSGPEDRLKLGNAVLGTYKRKKAVKLTDISDADIHLAARQFEKTPNNM